MAGIILIEMTPNTSNWRPKGRETFPDLLIPTFLEIEGKRGLLLYHSLNAVMLVSNRYSHYVLVVRDKYKDINGKMLSDKADK